MKNLYKKLRILPLFTVAVIISTLILMNGCGKNQDKNSIQVGVSISNFEDLFLAHIMESMEEYGKELGDEVDLIFLDAKEDAEKQTAQVRHLIEDKVDSIIVIPVDTSLTSRMTRMALESHTPIVYVNRYPDEFVSQEMPFDVYYVGSKEKNAGILQMKHLAEKLGGKGNIAVLMGTFENMASFQRTEGVEEVARNYPEINIIKKESAKFLRPMATSIVEKWLRSGLDFEAIIANNDEMAIGAIRALEKYDIEGVLVLGVDATADAVSEIKAGKLEATVFQDFDGQGRGAVDMAYKTAKKETVGNRRWIPYRLITLDNYKSELPQE